MESECTGQTSCPGVHEIKCLTAETCPDVVQTSTGDFLVIGEVVDAEELDSLLRATGAKMDFAIEDAVLVPRDVVLAAARRLLAEVDGVR